MKPILLVVGVTVLVMWGIVALDQSSNEDLSNERDAAHKFYAICLDGVSYWHLKQGYAEVLAPKFNSNSKVELCK